jgi:hypothetical protein
MDLARVRERATETTGHWTLSMGEDARVREEDARVGERARRGG